MKWTHKAKIQSLVAKLPCNFSYKAYSFIQRKFGGLKQLNPTSTLSTGINILNLIHDQGKSVESKTFLEIGTGRRLCLPIALWLCGASEIITVDLNPYLREELVFEDISYMEDNQQNIKTMFGKYSEKQTFQERFDKLINSENNLDGLLDMMNIRYLAPADASCLDLLPQSIDYQASRSVFEHIPPEILKDILLEGKRLSNRGGLSIHVIDFSDHFSHSDSSISAINFLRFSESEWKRYAGNRYAYHNRLRIDDFIDLFNNVGLKVLFLETCIDQTALEKLKKGFSLDEKFSSKSEETNTTSSATIVASFDESA